MAWPPQDMEDVVEYVKWQGDLAEIELGLIRDACGWDRLKVHVLDDVKTQLDKYDLASLVKLRQNQRQKVWVYRRGTPMADVLDGSRLLSEAGIETLGRVPQSVPRVRRLRQIFCQLDED